MLDLPPTNRDRVYPNEVFIDATPDGKYALRILRYYRERCNEKWVVDGINDNTKLLYEEMNKHQDQRAKELDAAIKTLLEK